jgi:2-C-methyl-D-erythritol 2,4-cyclodiphosphate synthase
VSVATGIGWDSHRLVEGRPLILGGVTIPSDRGLAGHSDADVLAHAVIDALLGAAGLGDIGGRFPDTDPRWKDASSEALLADVMKDVGAAWRVVNLDVTVIAERPKLAPHREAIRARLAARLGTSAVNVKAKTAEGLGPVGAGDAIECHAVVQLEKKG